MTAAAGRSEPTLDPAELAHAGLRGTIAAMAMTGMRAVTQDLRMISQSPPEAVYRQRARRLLRKAPRQRRKAMVELSHWAYGAGGGVAFGALPDTVRRRAWAGPAYGLALWAVFEALIAPALNLAQARGLRIGERTAFAIDHLLYGFVLSETRRRPQR